MSEQTIFPELHSQEVQEIISRPPHWLVKSGTGLFFSLMFLLGIGTALIRYPDIITTPFTLTGKDAPRTVVIRMDGKLTKLLAQDGQNVKKGQVVAYSESTADHVQVLKLSQTIEKIGGALKDQGWKGIIHFQVETFTELGEVQSDFQVFNQQLNELRAFLSGGFYLQKQKLLLEDLNNLRSMEQIISEQIVLQEKDYQLADNEFRVHEKLFLEKVISPVEYKREKAKLIAREMPTKSLAATLLQNRFAQTDKHKELLELDNIIREHKGSFLQSLLTLQSSVSNWKQKYILTAPVTGNISFAGPWQEQQFFSAGQELMTVEPKSSSFMGLVKIHQTNMGRLREGQNVLIKLDGFPYKEYGMIEGRLLKLSMISGKDSAYWGYIELPQNLKTRYGYMVPYRNGLKGQAEIVTAERSLASRLLSTFRDGGNNNLRLP